MHFLVKVTEVKMPSSFTATPWGTADFCTNEIWKMSEQNQQVNVIYEWQTFNCECGFCVAATGRNHFDHVCQFQNPAIIILHLIHWYPQMLCLW